MSLMDKFLDVMRLNGDDDDDEYEFANEEYYDDEVEEPIPKTNRRESKVKAEKEKKEETQKPVSKITPIGKSQKKQVNMEVCVIKPNKIEDEIEIVDTLISGRTILINMEGLNLELAQRIIDFTSGATYAMQGSLQKVSNYIFLATPNGVDISGDIQNLMDTFDGGNSFTI